MKKVFVTLFAVLMVFTCTACSKPDDIAQLSKNLTNYNITLEYNDDNKSVVASSKVDYVNSTDNILKKVKFHLYPQYFEEGATDMIVSSTKMNEAYPNGMSYAVFDVKRVQVNKRDINVVYEGEHDGILVVNLDSSLMPNERVEIMIDFSFTIPNCEHRFGYGEHTVNLGNFYPVACVYENGDFNTSPYNANGDPFYSDMANYDVTLTLDDKLKVAATGDLSSETKTKEKKTLKYNARLVRDFACVFSDGFEIHTANAGKVKVEYYGYDDIDSAKSLQAGVDAINTFSKLFGAFPYATFRVVKTDFVYGGMEYPNLVMISDAVDNIDDYMNVIVHETAHQWWYGMVGNDEYRYPWLDEALTEFSTMLFYDHNDGYTLTHNEMVDISKANYTLFIHVYEDVLGKIDTSMRAVNEYSTEPEYTYITYVKGVLMYESLYQLIGEKCFVSCLKAYQQSFKYKNATPDDLIKTFEKESKTKLDGFFSSWIEGKVIIR